MKSNQMTSLERKAVISLSAIMALRMIGLFMVLPVFSIYAQTLNFATPTLVGIAIGIYGLGQAVFQIPFGALSDRVGRKPVILAGLLIFAAGSLIAANAHSIYSMLLGRALQGMGAVGSTILAMMADLTREDQRTKSMMISGMTIGLSFTVAMFLGPVLTKWVAINHLFYIAALMGCAGIGILYTATPTPLHTRWHRDAEPELKSILKLLVAPELAKLNIGIFILHAIFTASFVVLPIELKKIAHLATNLQWHYYLPALVVACFISLFCMGLAERKAQVKTYFLGGIATLIAAELLFWFSNNHLLLALCLFFSGFTLLEAFLPSLVSRTAPATRKGSAMGIYSSSQFLGIFVGGLCGGWLYGHAGFAGVYLFCAILGLSWFTLAFFMQPPRMVVTRMLRLSPAQQASWDALALKLNLIPGMVETTFIAEDGVAYLKMERATAKDPAYLALITGVRC